VINLLSLSFTKSFYLAYRGEWPGLTGKPRSLGLGSKILVSALRRGMKVFARYRCIKVKNEENIIGSKE
jgi:hypothetical protein